MPDIQRRVVDVQLAANNSVLTAGLSMILDDNSAVMMTLPTKSGVMRR
jgi:hypothetical protein